MLSKDQTENKLEIKILFILLITCILFSITAFNIMQETTTREPDKLKWFTGSGSGYRLNDSTLFHYGNFYFTSESKKTKISAKRLKVSDQSCEECNYFENHFLYGKVFKDAVNIYTNDLIWLDMMTFSADEIYYSDDFLKINLRGNAIIGDVDILVESNNINVILSYWNKPYRDIIYERIQKVKRENNKSN